MKAVSRNAPYIVIAAILAAGSYANTLGHEFVFDDIPVIVENARLHSWSAWHEIVGSTWWPHALYRPATQLSFAVDWHLGGGDPGLFHLVNLLLHTLTTILLFVVMVPSVGRLAAILAALLFAVHPVHVEAVASVVGRAEILAALFTLLVLWAYQSDGQLAQTKNDPGRRIFLSLAVLVGTLLALASKESAFALPALLFLIDWLAARSRSDPPLSRFRAHWPLWVGTLTVALAWLLVRAEVTGSVAGDVAAPGLQGLDLFGRILAMAPVVLEYVRLLFFPAQLSADYSLGYLTVSPELTLLGMLGFGTILVVVFLGIYFHRSAPAITFGLAWMGFSLLIVSNVVVPSGIVLAERSLYLASIGAVVMLGWIGRRSVRRFGVPAALVWGLVVALGFGRTVTRNEVWSDSQTFFANLVEDAPGSFRSLWTEGVLKFDSGQLEEGEALLREAVMVHPLHPSLWSDLGFRMARMGRFGEAADYFEISFRLDSLRVREAHLATVNALRSGRPELADSISSRLHERHPDQPLSKIALSEVALDQGQYRRAMTLRRQAAWLEPETWQYWYLTLRAALLAEYCPEVRRSLARIRDLSAEPPDLEALSERAEELGCGD